MQSESVYSEHRMMSDRSISIPNKSHRTSSSCSSSLSSNHSNQSFYLHNKQVIEPELVLESISQNDSLHSQCSIIEDYLKFESEAKEIDFRRNSITDFKKLDFNSDNNSQHLKQLQNSNTGHFNNIIEQSTRDHKCTNSISCQIL